MLKLSVPLCLFKHGLLTVYWSQIKTSVGIHSSRRARGMMSTGSGTWLAIIVEGFRGESWLLHLGSPWLYDVHCQTQREKTRKRKTGVDTCKELVKGQQINQLLVQEKGLPDWSGVEFNFACTNEQMKRVEPRPKRKTSHHLACYNHTYSSILSLPAYPSHFQIFQRAL